MLRDFNHASLFSKFLKNYVRTIHANMLVKFKVYVFCRFGDINI